MSTGIANQPGSETLKRFADIETIGLDAVELHDVPTEEGEDEGGDEAVAEKRRCRSSYSHHKNSSMLQHAILQSM